MKKIIGYYRKCDLLTMLGTLCSFIGITLALTEHFTIAVMCMVLSGICDAFDGTLARKGKYTKAQQTYGVQLDSLSDVLCFGAFPAILTTILSQNLFTKLICAFYLLCGVIRLAYFNTLSVTEENKQGKFIGVPITTVSIIYPLIFIILRMINFSLISKVMPIVLLLLGISFILRIEIPKVNVANIVSKIIKRYSKNYVLFPLFIILSCNLLYFLNNYSFINSIKQLYLTTINNWEVVISFIIILDSLFLILNCITKNSKRTLIILLSIITAIVFINDIKYNIMGIPLELSDVNYLNPANLSMMGNAGSSIGIWVIFTILKAIFVIMIGIVFIYFDKNIIIKITKKTTRILGIIVGILLITSFIIFSNRKNELVINNFYNTTVEELLNINTVSDVYNKYGFLQGLYVNTLYNNYIPEGYNKLAVKNILSNTTTKKTKWKKANVVFILSEAFSDLENMNSIKFNKKLMSHIDSYENSANADVLNLLVPSYGGISVNTEFEILTGASLSFLKPGFIPYTQYYNHLNAQYAPNIIKEFNNNGYETMYLTPWGETSYKSKYVYNLFGADRTVYGTSLRGEKKGEWYSDKSLMEDIYNELKTTKKGKYKFIMSATGQNHFPYNTDAYTQYDIKIDESEYTEEENKILLNYAQGVYDADKELNNLYNNIQKLDVPTIIVFFGDHLPYTINSNGTDPYTSSNYFNTNNNDLNTLRKYTTKAVILSNYDIEMENLEYINASYLGAYILNSMDLEISDYFKFIDNTRNIIPIFNRNVIYKDNLTEKINSLKEENSIALKNYKYVQYGSFYDAVQ